MSAKTTMAEQVAETMGNDGQRFTAADGRKLREVAEDAGGSRRTDGFDNEAWDYEDGSTLVASGGGWDVGMSQDCYCWEGAGHSCARVNA